MMRRLNREINETIRRETTRNSGSMSARQLELRIKKKIRRLYRDLDKSAEEIVREDQWDAYLVFKEAHSDDAFDQELVRAQNREL